MIIILGTQGNQRNFSYFKHFSCRNLGIFIQSEEGKNSKKKHYGEKSLNDYETFKIYNTSLHEDHLRLILNNS